MRLYLVQHGEALAREVDPDRPLSEKGRTEVGRMAAMLAGHVSVTQVLHSGKTRARQTAELLAVKLADGAPVEQMEGLAPDDPVAPVAQQFLGEKADTLVVGHLPFMARLVTRLISGSEDPAVVSFRPGSVACLEPADGVSWRLQWMLRPDLLGW